jgi:hypothetical protein
MLLPLTSTGSFGSSAHPLTIAERSIPEKEEEEDEEEEGEEEETAAPEPTHVEEAPPETDIQPWVSFGPSPLPAFITMHTAFFTGT